MISIVGDRQRLVSNNAVRNNPRSDTDFGEKNSALSDTLLMMTLHRQR
jgi:hypothetical protein